MRGLVYDKREHVLKTHMMKHLICQVAPKKVFCVIQNGADSSLLSDPGTLLAAGQRFD